MISTCFLCYLGRRLNYSMYPATAAFPSPRDFCNISYTLLPLFTNHSALYFSSLHFSYLPIMDATLESSACLRFSQNKSRSWNTTSLCTFISYSVWSEGGNRLYVSHSPIIATVISTPLGRVSKESMKAFKRMQQEEFQSRWGILD